MFAGRPYVGTRSGGVGKGAISFYSPNISVSLGVLGRVSFYIPVLSLTFGSAFGVIYGTVGAPEYKAGEEGRKGREKKTRAQFRNWGDQKNM